MKKIIFFDTETTGVNPRKNTIIQFSGIIEVDGVVKEKFNFCIAPDEDDEIDDSALLVNNKSKDEILKYPSARESFILIEDLLKKYVDPFNHNDKFYPAGYNIRFDVEFLKGFFEKTILNILVVILIIERLTDYI